MWRDCGYFATYLCLVKCPLRSTTVEEKSDFFNPRHSLLLTSSCSRLHFEKKGLALLWIRVSTLQQLHWSLPICKFRLSWCLCLEAAGNISTKRVWLLHKETQFLYKPCAPDADLWPLTLLIPQAATPQTVVDLLSTDSAAWSLQHARATFSGCDRKMCNPVWWIFMRHAGVTRGGCTCQHVQPQLRSSLDFGLCFKYQHRKWECCF